MKHIIWYAWGLAMLEAPLRAQTPVVRLTLGGGTATDLRGVRSGAYMVSPSATLLLHPDLRISLGARGTRFASQGWAVAGAASAEGRLPLGSAVALVVGLSADLTRASYRATYLQAEAIPALELRLGPATVWAGARAAAARTTIQETTTGSVPLPGALREGVFERSAVGPTFGASIALVRFAPGEDARLTYREDHGRPGGILVVDRLVGASLTRGRVALSGTLGVREAPGEHRTFGGGRLALSVNRGIAVFGGVESYPSNPLLGSAGGRAISAGVSLSSGGGISAGPAHARDDRVGPRPVGVPRPAAGLLRLSIAARSAAQVDVAGDWNQWRPIGLTRTADGVWYADLAIPPGEYRYAFRIDGRKWDVPKGVAAVNDGFGGRSAWLSVRKPERKS